MIEAARAAFGAFFGWWLAIIVGTAAAWLLFRLWDYISERRHQSYLRAWQARDPEGYHLWKTWDSERTRRGGWV